MTEFAVNTEHAVVIKAESIHMEGILHIPTGARGMVIFAHGSGSSRFSPRNQYIAKTLQQAKFATLLFDLLTQKEDEIDSETAQYRFDIDFLSKRLVHATNWVSKNPGLNKLVVGYFGASTGAGAALVAAARLSMLIAAVVSRGGRPDLAGESLNYVEAATLLIVGGDDETVIELNKMASEKLHCVKKIDIVPGATHLFEEPGKMEEVALLAREWFEKHLV
jgi:putative phosphoribosyl transferase